jgi:hypothetical protein
MYKTNPDIIGAAALIHGYEALCGLGITLIKNQMVEPNPVKIKINLEEGFAFRNIIRHLAKNAIIVVQIIIIIFF